MSRIRISTQFCQHDIYYGPQVYIGDHRDFRKRMWITHAHHMAFKILALFGWSPEYENTCKQVELWGKFCGWFYDNHKRGIFAEERDGMLLRIPKQRTTRPCSEGKPHADNGTSA